MSAFSIYTGPACPQCRSAIALSEMASGRQSCPRCRTSYEAIRFDPPLRRARVLRVAEAGPAGASPCAAHPANASVTSCERCGVFMCTLCRIDSDGQTLCPSCFERLFADGSLASARIVFKDYSRMGWSTFVVGLLFWPLACVVALMALFYGIRAVREKQKTGDSEGLIGAWILVVMSALQWVGSTTLFVLFFHRLFAVD
jgi:hypothetical protein